MRKYMSKYTVYECGDCAFYKRGVCELSRESVAIDKMACGDFEL